MAYTKNIRCQCGQVTGEACCWQGPLSQTVEIEWMPKYLRASHEAAGNRGCYPYNGAMRLRVTESCADLLVETDGEWTQVIGANK